jgi:thymidylate synthase ThyX
VELQEVGKRAFEELNKVVPSFVRRSDAQHRHHKSFSQFTDAMQSEIRILSSQHTKRVMRYSEPGVRLVSSDPDSVAKVAAALLYGSSNRGFSELIAYCKKLPEEDINRILDAACNARDNRRQKSPRALEQANFTFEILADFGSYRDLHRHRILTQERQLLSCDYGYYMPSEIEECGIEQEYTDALHKAKEAFDLIVAELPEEAQYIVPMAYNVRWYFTVNLRALQWICELRSSPAGHPSYRLVAQQLAKETATAFPQFERFFKFVDYEGYELGRLGQETRIMEKKIARGFL